MSREIKFRVYDQTSKDYTVYGIGEVVDEHFGLEIISRVVWWLKGIKHKFVIEQYTGLKDKNGKEIYEGDILEYTTYFYGKEKKHRTEVKWREWDSDDFGTPHNVGFFNIDGNEVIIGNIHENPELLGEKK